MSRIARLVLALVGGLTLVLAPLSSASAGSAPLYATAGTPFKGVVATFTSASCANVCTATIDWGDGATSGGTATTNGGSIDVSGTHTYGKGGTYQLVATLQQCTKCSNPVTRVMKVGNASVTTTTSPSTSSTSAATHPASNATTTTAGATTTVRGRRARVAFVVNGVATTLSDVRGDLVALIRNKGLNLVQIKESGDRSPVREVVASYLTTLIHDAVTAQELQRRGVTVTKRQLKIARRFDIRIYGKKSWNDFPARFRIRDIQRTAREIALAADEGFDLTKPREARTKLVALVIDLVRKANVTVAPRFGTWNAELAVVVPPQEGAPS